MRRRARLLLADILAAGVVVGTFSLLGLVALRNAALPKD